MIETCEHILQTTDIKDGKITVITCIKLCGLQWEVENDD